MTKKKSAALYDIQFIAVFIRQDLPNTN